MDKTCKNCKYWRQNGYREGWGNCEISENDCGMIVLRDDFKEPVMYAEFECVCKGGYVSGFAVLTTRYDFSCILWRAVNK